MTLRNFRIGTRLGMGFGLVLMLLIGTIATAILLGGMQRRDVRLALERSQTKDRLAGEMRASLLESGIAMRNVVLESEIAAFQRQADRARAERKRYAAARAEFEVMTLNVEEIELLTRAAQLDKEVEQPFLQAVALAQAMNADDAIKVMSTQVDPIQQKQIALLNKVQSAEAAAVKLVVEQWDESANRLNLLLVLLGAAALVGGGVAAWVCTRSITIPLAEAVQVANSVAAGNLEQVVPRIGNDEPALLLGSLEAMTSQLRTLVSGVRDTAADVASAARDIVLGQDEISSRTESQASSLQETAATMEELTVTVQRTAANAGSAQAHAADASRVARNGKAAVAKVVSAVDRIQRGSDRIAAINSVVSGIAFQTNILALNAAVEAARAGENGRGFAVVASEVRKLAQRSADAVKEIKQLLDEAADNAQSGSTMAESAGKTMDEMLATVEKVRSLIDGIATSAGEQSAGIAQVNAAVSDIDSATQRTVGVVQTSVDLAARLGDQAQRLTTAVSAFNTGG